VLHQHGQNLLIYRLLPFLFAFYFNEPFLDEDDLDQGVRGGGIEAAMVR
jgi:hypothetical protein